MKKFLKIILCLSICFIGFTGNVNAEEVNNNESNCSSSNCIIDSFFSENDSNIKVFNSSGIDITEDFYTTFSNHYTQNEKDIIIDYISQNNIYFLSHLNNQPSSREMSVHVEYSTYKTVNVSAQNSLGGTTTLTITFYVKIPARYSATTSKVITPLSSPILSIYNVEGGYDTTITSTSYNASVTNGGYSCYYSITTNVSSSDIAGLDLYATVDFNNINFSVSFSPADV
ncbi:MAG: hypothetical protein ACI319_10025 [Holdemanella porci]